MSDGPGREAREGTPGEGGWPFPQADRLETVRFVVYAVYHGLRTRADLEPALALDARHTRYYLNAAGILGLLEERRGVYRISERGRRLLATHPGSAAEAELLLQATRAASSLTAYMETLAGGAQRMELAQRIQRREGLAISTARRRARSLLRWYGYLTRSPADGAADEAGAPNLGDALTRWCSQVLGTFLVRELDLGNEGSQEGPSRLAGAVNELASRWYGAGPRPSPGRSRLRRAAYLSLTLASDVPALHHALTHVEDGRLLPPAQAHKLQLRRLALPTGGSALELLGFIAYLMGLGELPDRVEVLLPEQAEDWRPLHAFLRRRAVPGRLGQLELDFRYDLPALATGASDEGAAPQLPEPAAYADCIAVMEPLAVGAGHEVATGLRRQLTFLRQPAVLLACQARPVGGGKVLGVLEDYLDGFGRRVNAGPWQPSVRRAPRAAKAEDAPEANGDAEAALGRDCLALARDALGSFSVEHHVRSWHPGPEPILPRLQAATLERTPVATRPTAGQLSFLDAP